MTKLNYQQWLDKLNSYSFVSRTKDEINKVNQTVLNSGYNANKLDDEWYTIFKRSQPSHDFSTATSTKPYRFSIYDGFDDFLNGIIESIK